MQAHVQPGADAHTNETPRSKEAGGAPAAVPLTTEFHLALQEAIRNRGIGLSRIRARLEACGASVSVATLSYWQSGRSRPERPESLQAVNHLERVLELPNGALTSLLGPPRPRGRAAHNAKKQSRPEALVPTPDIALPLLEQVDLPGYRSLTKLSLHDQLLIGADRAKRYQFVRQVVRAEQDGIIGFPFLTQHHTDDQTNHNLSAIAHCRIGEIHKDPEHKLILAEILFDQPLRRGDSTMIEFLVESPSSAGQTTYHERVATCPIREVMFDIRFAGTLPSWVQRYESADDVETSQEISTRGNTIQILNTDWGPGICGVRWQW